MSRARRLIILLALAATFSGSASAQREAPERPSQRIESLRRALSSADDPRASAPRRVELAEALLDRLAADVSDIAVLFGVPSEAQTKRVRETATHALEQAQAARDELAEAIAAIERDPNFAQSKELQNRRSELVVEYQSQRAPMALARASLLVAASGQTQKNANPEREQRVEQALRLARGVETTDPVSEIRRLVIIAAARLIQRAEPAEQTEAIFRHAMDNDRASEVRVSAPKVWIEAVFGRALALTDAGRFERAHALLNEHARRPPIAEDGSSAPAWRLSLADLRFRIALRRADAMIGGGRNRVLAESCDVYVRLLRNGLAGFAPDELRTLIYEKLRGPVARGLGTDEAPALLRIARAAGLRRAGENLDEAQRLLETVVRQAEKSPSTDPSSNRRGGTKTRASGASDNEKSAMNALPEALWEISRVRLTRAERGDDGDSAVEHRVAAMRALFRLASTFPDWAQTSDALRAACEIGLTLRRAGANESLFAEPYRRALELAIDRLPADPNAERWKIELVKIGSLPADRAEALLASVGADSPLAAEARALEASLLRRSMRDSADRSDRRRLAERALERTAAAREALQSAPDRTTRRLGPALRRFEAETLLALDRPDDAIALVERAGPSREKLALASMVRRTLVDQMPAPGLSGAEAERLGESLVRAARAELDATPAQHPNDPARRALARGLLASGEPAEAIPIIESLIERRGRTRPLLRILAEARFAAGDHESAFAIYRDLVSAAQSAGRYDATFWSGWSRLLQILAARNEDGSRTGSIRREINRLRRLDENLGGEPFRSRIEAIESEITGT